jgi:hypothetical protein
VIDVVARKETTMTTVTMNDVIRVMPIDNVMTAEVKELLQSRFGLVAAEEFANTSPELMDEALEANGIADAVEVARRLQTALLSFWGPEISLDEEVSRPTTSVQNVIIPQPPDALSKKEELLFTAVREGAKMVGSMISGFATIMFAFFSLMVLMGGFAADSAVMSIIGGSLLGITMLRGPLKGRRRR